MCSKTTGIIIIIIITEEIILLGFMTNFGRNYVQMVHGVSRKSLFVDPLIMENNCNKTGILCTNSFFYYRLGFFSHNSVKNDRENLIIASNLH